MEFLEKLFGSEKGLSEEDRRERIQLRLVTTSFLITISLLILLISLFL